MKKKLKISVLTLAIVGFLAGTIVTPNADALVPKINSMVSVNNTGNGQGGNSSLTSNSSFEISGNGKFAVFASLASNLVSSDTNGYADVFLRNLDTNTTTRVSVSTSGVQGNNDSRSGYAGGDVAISETGRYVAFVSKATNLIDGQTMSGTQIYIRDTHTNTTSIVTKKSDGTLGNADVLVSAVSNDGRFVTWRGDRNTNLASGGITGTYLRHNYLADLRTRTFTLLNSGNYSSDSPEMSCDGALIVFGTTEQLVTQDTDSQSDVYLLDLRNGISVKGITTGSNISKYSVQPSISCNGNFITFNSGDYTLTSLVASTDTNIHKYLYDILDDTFSVVDTSSSDVVANATTGSLNGVDNKGNVVFSSSATNLTSFTTKPQMYLKNHETNVTEMVTVDSSGVQSNGVAGDSSISGDGKRVIYLAGGLNGTNILPGGITSDSNGTADVIMSLTGL